MDREVIGWQIVVLTLCSCGSTKVITEYKEHTVYDTLVIEKHDTIRQTEIRTLRDTLIEKHNIVHIITEKGDTAKTVENHDTYHGTFINDSTDYYKAVADIYMEMLRDEQEATKEQIESSNSDMIDSIKTILLRAIILVGIILLTIIIWRVKK